MSRWVKGMLVGLPTPVSLKYFWKFGSMLLIVLSLQLVTGMMLAMSFVGSAKEAFKSVDMIAREVWSGWIIRSMHSKGASLFFLFMYLHMGRSMFFGSFRSFHTWSIGTTMFLISMGTAFLGYALPWGQMSFWAATVITNFVSSIPYVGNFVVIWLWGGYSVKSKTLTRFFALHYLLPFVIVVLVLFHKIFAHEVGSKTPLGLKSKGDKVKFHSFFSWKDVLGFGFYVVVFAILLMAFLNLFLDPENFMESNPLVTPVHMQPEWYFLPFYAILRAVPKKLGGVMALLSSIFVFYLVPLILGSKTRTMGGFMLPQFFFIFFICVFVILGWMGAKPVEPPYSNMGFWFTLFYFSYFLFMGKKWVTS